MNFTIPASIKRTHTPLTHLMRDVGVPENHRCQLYYQERFLKDHDLRISLMIPNQAGNRKVRLVSRKDADRVIAAFQEKAAAEAAAAAAAEAAKPAKKQKRVKASGQDDAAAASAPLPPASQAAPASGNQEVMAELRKLNAGVADLTNELRLLVKQGNLLADRVAQTERHSQLVTQTLTGVSAGVARIMRDLGVELPLELVS